MHQRYRDRVGFLVVYVRESHARDEWSKRENDQAGILMEQPRDHAGRTSLADTCCTVLGITMPATVDEMDDRVARAYSGMPDRLYIIDRQGRVAYKSGRGTFGFKPGEMEQALVLLLLDEDM